MSPLVLSRVSLGGGQGGQEWQTPDAASPRNIGQQHHGKPAQSAGFDEVAVRGAYRIAVDSTRLDLAAPSSLESVIKTDDDGAIGNKGADQAAATSGRRSVGSTSCCDSAPDDSW